MTAAKVDAPAVFAAFLAVQADLNAIPKGRRVQEGPARFAFRGVDDVMQALHPLMSKHGLIGVPIVQERIPEARATRSGSTMNVVHVRVRFVFYAADGSTFHMEVWGEGQDSGDKATGKALSMAYKSAWLQAFHIPTEDTPDADLDTTPAEPVRPRPPFDLDAWAVRVSVATDEATLRGLWHEARADARPEDEETVAKVLQVRKAEVEKADVERRKTAALASQDRLAGKNPEATP